MGFPGSSVVKNPPAKQEMQARFLGWEEPPGEGHGNPFYYPCLGNPVDRGAWQVTNHEAERVKHRLATKPLTPLFSVTIIHSSYL